MGNYIERMMLNVEVDELGNIIKSKKYHLGVEVIDSEWLNSEGISKGCLVTLGAESGVGKTELSILFMQSFARQDRKVLFASLEMGAEQLFELAVQEGKFKSIEDNETYRNNLNISFDISNINDLADTITIANRDKGIDVFVIDSYLPIETGFKNSRDNMDAITKMLDEMKRTLNVTIVLIAQWSRADAKDGYYDFSGGTTLKYLSDFVLFIEKFENSQNKNTIERSKLSQRLNEEFIQFIYHANFDNTGVSAKEVFDTLLTDGENAKYKDAKGNNISLPAILSLIQKKKLQRYSKINNNLIIKKLNVQFGKTNLTWDEFNNRDNVNNRDSNFDNVGIFTKKFETSEKDDITNALMDIKLYYPDLYNDIVKVSLATAGIRNNEFSFFKFIPYDDYLNIVQPNVEELDRMIKEEPFKVEDFMMQFRNQFFIRNFDLLPMVSPTRKYNNDTVRGSYPYGRSIEKNRETGERTTVIYRSTDAGNNKVAFDEKVKHLGSRRFFVGYQYIDNGLSAYDNNFVDNQMDDFGNDEPTLYTLSDVDAMIQNNEVEENCS